MVIQITTTSEVPIYLQIRNQIVIGIGTGELTVGQSLPTVRQMASDIGINMMTVNKAYNILKNEGYIEIDRRHGAKVSQTPNGRKEFVPKMEYDLKLLITESALNGVSKQEFIELCNRLYDEIKVENDKEEIL